VTVPRRRQAGATLVALLAGAVSLFARDSGVAPTAVSLSSRGFEPATLNARRDEAMSLGLTSADGEHCFSLDAFRVEKRVLPGRTVAVRFTPDVTGRFPYRCCLHDGESGTLVVSD
jgi:cytochrome c oxidase subunit II